MSFDLLALQRGLLKFLFSFWRSLFVKSCQKDRLDLFDAEVWRDEWLVARGSLTRRRLILVGNNDVVSGWKRLAYRGPRRHGPLLSASFHHNYCRLFFHNLGFSQTSTTCSFSPDVPSIVCVGD